MYNSTNTDALGTEITGFTSATVQILTQTTLLENYCHAESEQQTLVAPLRGKGMGVGKGGGGAVGGASAQQRGKVSGSSR